MIYNPSVFLLFLSITITSIAQNHQDSIVLKKIDSLQAISMGKYDSVAFINHHKVLRMAREINDVPNEMKAYQGLAWYFGHSFGDKKEKTLDSTLYYFDLFENKEELLDTDENPMMAVGHYMNKGNMLANGFGLVESGLEAYYKGYKYLNPDDINTATIYDVYISQVYMYKKQYVKALETVLPRMEDTASLKVMAKLYLMQNVALYYNLNEQPNQSLEINKVILKKAKELDNEQYIWWTKNEMSYDEYLLGNTEKAIDSALAVREYYTNYAKNINQDILFNNSENLSKYYYKAGNLDKAIYYQEDLLKYPNSTAQLPDCYTRLISYYKEKGNYASVLDFYEKKEKVLDSIRSMEAHVYTTYAAANLKLLKEKRINQEVVYENELLKEKNSKQQLYTWIMSVIIVCLLLIFITFFYLRKYKRSKKDITILKTNEKFLLEEQIRLRDNELEASAMAISQKVSELNKIKHELDKCNDNDTYFKNVQGTINEFIKSSSDITVITDRIESQYPKIAIELKSKYPELSDTEIRYCLFTKLNLTIKETANILNVSPNTVKVTRSRLKKKMGVSKEESLKSYLDHMYTNKMTTK